MKQFLQTVTAASLVILFASCGGGVKEKKSVLTEKKTELQKLQTDRAKIDEQIKALEAEIVKLDTSATMNQGKLVAVVPVISQPFEHYIDLQGHVDADNVSYITPRGGPGQVKALYIKKGDFV